MTQSSINNAPSDVLAVRRPNFLCAHMNSLLLARFRWITLRPTKTIKVDLNSFHLLGDCWRPDKLLGLVDSWDNLAHVLLRRQIIFTPSTMEILAEWDTHKHGARDLENFLFRE